MAGAVLTLRGRCASRTVPESIEIEGRGDAVIVGRSRKDADVCLDLPPPSPACLISRQHAKLRRVGGGAWVLSDLGSLNGVTLNETRLKAGVERPLSDGDVIRFGGAGLPGGPGDAGELRLGECATYVFQTSSKRPRCDDDKGFPEPATESQESRKRPRRRRAGSDENLVGGGVSSPHSPKRLPSPRRIVAPETASNDDALKAAAACFDAVSRDRDALTAARAAAPADGGAALGAAALRSAALAQLRCAPCGEPLACALVLPCGHALDECCFIRRCFDRQCDAAVCPCCGSRFAPGRHALRRSGQLDAAVEALVLGDAALLAAHERRLDAAAAARADAGKHLAAVPDPDLRDLLADLVYDQTPSQCAKALPLERPDKLLMFKWDTRAADTDDDDDEEDEDEDEEDEAGVVVCSGCGERGHTQDECPHRSDISDDEAISDDDGEDFS